MFKWLMAFLVVFPLLGSASYGQEEFPPTEQEQTIQQEIDQLTLEVSERMQKIATLQARMKKHSTPRGLAGYCPVTLVEEQKWQPGNANYQVAYEGVKYCMAGEKEELKFLQSPQKYVPIMSGYDPVLLVDEGKRVRGERRYGWFYRGRFVLLSSRKTLEQFSIKPERYMLSEKNTLITK